MKKSILALSIVIASGSAFAGVDLYEADNIKVNIGGTAKVQYFKAYGEDKKADLQLKDGQIAINLEAKLSDTLTGLGFYELQREEHHKDIWVGLKGDFGTVKVGKLATAWDDKGAGKAIDLGKDGGTYDVPTSGTDAVRWDGDFGAVYASLGYDMSEANGEPTDYGHVDGRIGFKSNGFDVAALAAQGEKDLGGDKTKVKGYAVKGSYDFDNIGLSGAYQANDFAAKGKINVIQLAASYNMDKLTFAAGVDVVKGKDGIDDDYRTVYLNAKYKLGANFEAFAEVGQQKAGDVSSTGYLTGMSINF